MGIYVCNYMLCMYWAMCVRVYTGARVCLYSCEYMCVWLHVAAIRTRSWDPNPVTEDPESIRICVRYEPNTLAIRRLTHEMIQIFVPVRAVKTRWRFEFKIASFHVSVSSHVISLFTVTSRCSCIYSYYFIWLSDILYQYDYAYHFMRY